MTVATLDSPTMPDGSLARWVGIASAAAMLADRIANTDFVPEAMRNNPAMVTAAIMYGDELGIGPMQALAGINVIKGKPSPSSELMRALVFRDGHSLKILKSDGTLCRVAGKRRDEAEPTVIEWTIETARSAGLLDGNPVWRRYPRAMLLARATSELCRVMFPDVVKGLGHVADDDADAPDWDAWAAHETSTDPEPERRVTTISRRRADPVHPSGASRPVQSAETLRSDRPMVDTPLPEQGTPEAMGAPERDEQWPDGIDQPPLPMGEPGGQTAAAGIPSRVNPEPVAAPPSEPLPEPDDNEPFEQAGKRTLAVMHMLFNDIGVPKDERAYRLAITSRIVGREITTSNELTRNDALNVVRMLNDAAVRLIRFDPDPTAPYGVAIIPTPSEDANHDDST